MSALQEHADDYLRLRRALGFKLEEHGRLLPQLVAHLEAAGATSVVSELAIAWARLPEDAQPSYWAQRLTVARRFAAYMKAIDPATELPPRDVFAAGQRRPTPYLWSTEEINRLLEAARTLRAPLRAATYEALFGLLAVSGMRVGEAIALTRDDVDLAAGVITITKAKFDRSRLVPLHETATEALRRYAARRDDLCPRPTSTAFFLSAASTQMTYSGVRGTFVALTTTTGIRTDAVRPRLHGLRHSFAVDTLVGWQRSGTDVAVGMPALSDYLGHVHPAGTYWYLSATPELMQLAADRLDQRFGAPR
jgi:integrase